MGHKVPWKTGMLICHLVTSRPLIFTQKEAVLSPCNFATARLTASILHFYLPLTSQPHEMEDPFAMPQASFSIRRQRVGARVCRSTALKYSNIVYYAVKCGNRLHVGVKSVRVACRPFYGAEFSAHENPCIVSECLISVPLIIGTP